MYTRYIFKKRKTWISNTLKNDLPTNGLWTKAQKMIMHSGFDEK